jgi:hypothetical protein
LKLYPRAGKKQLLQCSTCRLNHLVKVPSSDPETWRKLGNPDCNFCAMLAMRTKEFGSGTVVEKELPFGSQKGRRRAGVDQLRPRSWRNLRAGVLIMRSVPAPSAAD